MLNSDGIYISNWGIKSVRSSLARYGTKFGGGDTAAFIRLFHFISTQGVDVKFQAFPERIEFHGVSPQMRVFQGFDWSQVTFSRPSKFKTLLPFIVTLQRQIIQGEREIFQGFLPGRHLGYLPIFQGCIKQSKFYIYPPVWLFLE